MENKQKAPKKVAFVKADAKDYEGICDSVKAFCKAMNIPWDDDVDEAKIRALWEKYNPPPPDQE